ncbi:hypothetical protein FisN_25Hu013 [Fistulifera solaris]|uniref:Uncharacterized protein n=1 Tax=Fistulifera solaris TaxID=1519565 RepID=A0A1Z5JVT6_FISSO|nr:hypothetical protein FisN_25Hu013 [Fistulifera solaris]|eukprot:GAX18039.1 hypothetical protein FisN_25Hu013 [Fistulifera solaris]
MGVTEINAEVKCLLALAIYDKKSSYRTMTVARLKKSLATAYHGKDGKYDYPSRFGKGQDEFSAVVKEENINGQLVCVLDPVLHRHTETVVTVGGEDCYLTVQSLKVKSKRSPDLLEGTTLRNYITDALKMAKKALAIIDAYLVDGQMRSGKRFPEDYAEHLLSEMHRILFGPNAVRKPNWFFRGFFAFMAWGPIPLGFKMEYKSKLFNMKELQSSNETKSRKTLRQEELQDNSPAKKPKPLQPVEKLHEVKVLQLLSVKAEAKQRLTNKKESVLEKWKENTWRDYQEAKFLAEKTGNWDEVMTKKKEYDEAVKKWKMTVDAIVDEQPDKTKEWKAFNSYLKRSDIVDMTGENSDDEKEGAELEEDEGDNLGNFEDDDDNASKQSDGEDDEDKEDNKGEYEEGQDGNQEEEGQDDDDDDEDEESDDEDSDDEDDALFKKSNREKEQVDDVSPATKVNPSAVFTTPYSCARGDATYVTEFSNESGYSDSQVVRMQQARYAALQALNSGTTANAYRGQKQGMLMMAVLSLRVQRGRIVASLHINKL